MALIDRSGGVQDFSVSFDPSLQSVLDELEFVTLVMDIEVEWEAQWFNAVRKGRAKTIIESFVFSKDAQNQLQRDLNEFVADLVEPDITFAFSDAPNSSAAIEDVIDSSGEQIEVTSFKAGFASVRLKSGG